MPSHCKNLYVVSHTEMPEFRKIKVTSQQQDTFLLELNAKNNKHKYPGKWKIEFAVFDYKKGYSKLVEKLDKKYEKENDCYKISKYRIIRKVSKYILQK